MGDPLKNVQDNQPLRIPADAYNAFVAAAKAHRARQVDRDQKASAGAGRPPGLVKVRNDSGDPQPRFAVLGIGDVLIQPEDNLSEFQRIITFSGVTPSAETHRDRFVILFEPLAAGSIGDGYADGLCAVKINVVSEEHTLAEVIDADASQMQSSETGNVVIIWKESGTGSKWAVIRFGGAGSAESVGQYIGMAHLVVAQNTVGWDFMRYTAPLE